MKTTSLLLTVAIAIASGCNNPTAPQNTSGNESNTKPATFQDDLTFMESHTAIVVLKNASGAAVALAPEYQGRVMTSTFDAQEGPSFGWINRPVIEKGLLADEARKGQLEEHIYVFGGEERFWLGPEGGQFSLYFKPETKFEFSQWFTPAAIDTDAYKVANQENDSAKFTHQCDLMNHSGTKFKVGIERTVTLLEDDAVKELLSSDLPEGIKFVAYETDNRITNAGEEAWTSETGLISIWILGMYNPSPTTNIVIPFKPGSEAELGPKVNDAYFGEIPAEHLKIEDDVLFMRGDGTRRGKIGISPQRAAGIAGSYDAGGGVLTVVTYNQQPAPNGYVNSMWELQDEPFAGDLINAYNDGSPEPGKPPLGPFYELETSSPAASLAPGETMKHVQRTWHLQGSEKALDPIAKKLLGVGIEAIKTSFEKK